MTYTNKDYRTTQDRATATWWLDEAINKAKGLKTSGMVAYTIFTERMIKNKFRIEEWHLEYIGKNFGLRRAGARSYSFFLQIEFEISLGEPTASAGGGDFSKLI